MISISYECSYTPPFIARDTLAVLHQHLEAKVALGRQAGMQEDSAVECSTEPSNINYIGSYIPSAWHLQRICSAKLQVLRKGRHGGQREKRSFAHPRSCAQKTTTLGAGDRPIVELFPTHSMVSKSSAQQVRGDRRDHHQFVCWVEGDELC